MKRTILLLPVLALIFLGAGCGESIGQKVDDGVDSATETASEKIAEEAAERALEEQGEDGEVDVDDKAVSVTTDEGTFSVGEDVDLPDGFPSEIPLYENSKITTASASAQSGEYSATLSADGSYDEVVSYYKNALAKNGWTLGDTNTANFNGTGFTTFEATGNDMTLNVTVTSDVGLGDGKVQVILGTDSAD